MELIARGPWREAVTYRDTWPPEYVLIKEDGQQELLVAFCARIADGEGVEGPFFSKSFMYLFLGDHKYWTYTPCARIDLDATADDFDRRDFEVDRSIGHEMIEEDTTMPHRSERTLFSRTSRGCFRLATRSSQ